MSQNFSDYSSVPVLGRLSERDKNQQRMTKIAVNLEQLKFLESKNNSKAKEKAKKLSKDTESLLRRYGIKMGLTNLIPVEDRVVRVMSGGTDKKTGNVSGIIQIPFGLSSSEKPGTLSPRVSFSGDKINIDFARSGSSSSNSMGLQGNQTARLEVESFLLSNKSDIKNLLK